MIILAITYLVLFGLAVLIAKSGLKNRITTTGVAILMGIIAGSIPGIYESQGIISDFSPITMFALRSFGIVPLIVGYIIGFQLRESSKSN